VDGFLDSIEVSSSLLEDSVDQEGKSGTMNLLALKGGVS
jgi:hypothetical protein